MSLISRGLRLGAATGAGPALKNLVSSPTPTLFPPSNQSRATLGLITKFYFATQPANRESIDKLVKHNKIVIFMKGVPTEPKCGFSNAVVKILDMHGVQNYDSHDVLADEGLRQGIKDYSNWPTIPQVYINGEFVGGCDIMLEMHKNGELVEELKKAGIRSALLDADEVKTKSEDNTKTKK